ncbi:hypothetical protein AMJ71_09285 [candidate division TA06 bacterium SM1_40]|uniref:Uncharacterized protein n=2 Tax=Bacteria division TA06 TaxID=1156500 RepID=A0A0S8JAY3_UNCT6|nr:MAG: hypothetical protein AMJ82_04045 [candidate division TA06 bacterium SM23_40]KPL06778.1 MAG: hypothetical protein AMJ71_09285 [candidate division TA06 bacterium SM1_40]
MTNRAAGADRRELLHEDLLQTQPWREGPGQGSLDRGPWRGILHKGPFWIVALSPGAGPARDAVVWISSCGGGVAFLDKDELLR